LLEIETLGASGLRYRMRTKNDRRWHERRAFQPPRLSDAAGSGDWLTAGLIDQLCRSGVDGLRALDGHGLVEALDYAQSLSAWNCAFEGARGGMYGMTVSRLAAVAANIRAHTTETKLLTKERGSVSRGAFCGECARPATRPKRSPAPARSRTKRKSTTARA
jgi:fructokinase